MLRRFQLIAVLAAAVTSGAAQLASHPLDSGPQRGLAEASRKLRAKDFAGACAVLSALTERYPNLGEAQNLLGVCLVQLGEASKAREAFEKAVQLDSTLASAYLNLASLLLALKDQAGAVRSIKKAVTVQPDILAGDPKAYLMYYLLGLDAIRNKEPEKGAKYFQSGYQRNAQVYSIAFLQAKQDFIESKYRDAADLLEAIRPLRAPHAEFHELAGSVYYVLNDPKKASDEFQQAIRMDSQNDQLYFKLAMVYLKHHTPALAIYVLDQALRQRPRSAFLWYAMGLSQHLADQVESARKSLLKAIALDPSLKDAYVVLGDLLEQAGRPQEALEIFDNLIKLDPNLSIGWYYYGKLTLEASQSDVEKSIEALRRSIQLNPGFAAAHYELGKALERAGKLQEAIAEFNQSLAENPNLSESRYRLAIIFRKLGDSLRAAREFQSFQESKSKQSREDLLKRLEYRIGKPE